MIIVFVILIVISCFLSHSYRREGEKEIGFWKQLFATVSLKVVDYYCVGTPSKITALALRLVFSVYTAASVGFPVIKASYKSASGYNFWEVLFSWDEISTTITYVSLGLIGLITVVYLICCKYDQKALQSIEEKTNIVIDNTDRLETTTNKILDNSEQILNILTGKNNSLIQRLLPITIDNINHLKLTTAYSYLDEMRVEADKAYQQDLELQADILYWMGCCSRFTGNAERCKEEYTKAFSLMETTGKSNQKVIAGMVYVNCKEEREEDAKRLAERLKAIDFGNVWAWVPKLHFTDDLHGAYGQIKNEVSEPERILATELMIRSRETIMLPELMTDYKQEKLTVLTFTNLPLWVLNLSVELNKFVQSWRIMPAGMNMSNESSKKLFQITDSYLKCLKETEIKNILPDTEYLHALTGYCQDKQEMWVEIIKKSPFSEGHKEIYYLSYALMLVDTGRPNDALDFLRGYGDEPTGGILNYRMHVAIMSGHMEDVEDVFKIAEEKQVVIYDNYLNYFISYARFNYDKVKDYAGNLNFYNPLSKAVYAELLKFWAGEKVDVKFLQDSETEVDAIFRPYISLVYQKYLGNDEALRLAKSCLPENALDIRTYIYIDLLQSNPANTKELYHFLTSLRRKGLDEDDRLIEIEMNLSEKMEDHLVSRETSAILVKRHPDVPAYWEHYLIAMSTEAGHEDEIIESLPKVKSLALSYSQVYNIYKVLHIVGKDEAAIDFLYDGVEKTNSQELRDEYFKASLNEEMFAIISKQEEEAKEGSYIMYEEDGQRKFDTIRTGGLLEGFIDQKPGAEIKENHYGQERKLTLLAVFNKYFKLMQEVGEDVAANKSTGILSINSNSEEFQTNPMGVFNRITGNTPEQRAQHEADLNNYRSGNLALIAFTGKWNFIVKMYELLFNDFKLISIPDPSVDELCKKFKIDMNKMDWVLDMSSLIMLHELDMLFGLNIVKKMLLPKGVVNQIDYAILYEKKEMPSFFGGKGINKLKVKEAEEGDSKYATKLKMLKSWAEEKCRIEVVEDKLNMNYTNLKTVATSVESESLILANHQGRVLITEDWTFCKNMAGVFPAMSVSNLLYIIDHPRYEEVARFMTSTNRVGQNVSSMFICEQYDKMRRQEENCWNLCLENIGWNPLLYVPAIDAAARMSEGIVIPSKNVAIQALLVTVFKSALPETVMAMQQVALLKSRNINYRQNLADAMRICYPELS